MTRSTGTCSTGRKLAWLLWPMLLLAGLAVAQEYTPPEVRTATSDRYGAHLVDANDRSLYLFVAEDAGAESARLKEGVQALAAICTGECLQAWPPLDAPGGPQAGAGVKEELLYTELIEGVNQVVYNGWPLHYFVRDEEPGQAQGHGVSSFGGEWFLVSPRGQPLGDEAEGAVQARMRYPEAAEALEDVRVLLMEGGLAAEPTPRVIETFEEWRSAFQASGDPGREVVATSVGLVISAFSADPFDEDVAIRALRNLALTMRIVASKDVPDEQSIIEEVASLVQQTADLIENDGYTPRLDVEVP